MSVRVNLLPQASREQARSARQRNLAGLVAVLVLTGIGLTHAMGLRQLDVARGELAAEEQRTGELRGDVAAMAEFRVLAQRRDDTLRSLQTTLGAEYSMADVLRDVAAVVPDDTQLDVLSVTTLPTTGLDRSLRDPIAVFNARGLTVTSHAPGVERLLLEFGTVASFRDLYLNSSRTADPAVTEYTVDGRISAIARTGRYDAGLPEALR